MVCYNGSALLPESLAGLKAQSFEDWELVFWNNGSHDGSADLARAFDTRTRVLGGSERLTLGAARGKALQAARGDLIAFLDHDDLWRADKLERQVEIMTGSEIGLCYSDCEVIDAEGTELGRYARRVKPHEGRVLHPLLVENFIPTVTVMISREAYEAAGPFDPTLNMPAVSSVVAPLAAQAASCFTNPECNALDPQYVPGCTGLPICGKTKCCREVAQGGSTVCSPNQNC